MTASSFLRTKKSMNATAAEAKAHIVVLSKARFTAPLAKDLIATCRERPVRLLALRSFAAQDDDRKDAPLIRLSRTLRGTPPSSVGRLGEAQAGRRRRVDGAGDGIDRDAVDLARGAGADHAVEHVARHGSGIAPSRIAPAAAA